jgi:uncharacterized protein with PIN domain
MKMAGTTKELLERIAAGIEKIADEPILQTEGGPPVCPHCNSLNPRVSVAASDETSGPFVQFFVPMRCESCGKVFFAVPLEWASFTGIHEAREEIGRREAALNGNGSN